MVTAAGAEFRGRGPVPGDSRRAGGHPRPATATRGPPGDILALVAWGMDRELREVFGLVRAKLEEIAEEND
jgi:hypothetical protein